jgi:hypothetical protein|tara:strand:- start:603 stop:848 length:246 start_codon:yes stop_codon:yes gene_type:complete
MKEMKHAKGTFENPWIFCEDRMIKLESVGSWLNYDKGIIYPMFDEGDIDMESATSIIEEEVSSEWWESLSPSDYQIVKKFY